MRVNGKSHRKTLASRGSAFAERCQAASPAHVEGAVGSAFATDLQFHATAFVVPFSQHVVRVLEELDDEALVVLMLDLLREALNRPVARRSVGELIEEGAHLSNQLVEDRALNLEQSLISHLSPCERPS